MNILFLVFLFLTVVSFTDLVKCPLALRITLLIVSGILLALVAGLRYGDRDYVNYLEMYSDAPTLFSGVDTSVLHGEPGYIFINSFFKTIGVGSVGVFLFMSFSSVSLSLNFFRKNSPYFLIAVLIYFSHVFMLRDMMQIRAGLAASISLYALRYIQDRRFLPFLGVILLAASFHSGVLILILAYLTFPYFRGRDTRIKYVAGLGFILGLLLKASIIEFIITTFFNIPAVAIYLAEPEYFVSLGLFNIVLLKNVLLLILVFYYKEDIKEHVPNFDAMLISLALGIFWLSAFNNFAIFAARLATYFANVEHILLPALFLTKLNKFLLWGIVVCYCLVMYLSKFSIFNEMTYLFWK